MQAKVNLSIVNEYVRWQEEHRRRTATTMRMYRSVLRTFWRWLEDRPLDGVSAGEIEEHLGRVRYGRAQGQRPSAATQSKDATIIRGLYVYAFERGYIEKNPTGLLATPTVQNRQPRPLGDAQWLAAWRLAETHDERGILALGYYLGLRRQEMGLLDRHHVDQARHRLVNFPRKAAKEGIVPYATILDVYAQHLPALLPDRAAVEEAIVSVPLHLCAGRDPLGAADQVNDVLARVCGRGVDWFTPHQLRHSCATNLLRAGVPIHIASRMLDHSDIQTTMRYVKAGGDELADWLNVTPSVEASRNAS